MGEAGLYRRAGCGISVTATSGRRELGVPENLHSETPASSRPPLRNPSILRRKSPRPDQGFWDALCNAGRWPRTRCAVDRDTPSRRAASRTGSPRTESTACRETWRGGRPSRRPSRLTRASPARTRSAILARSNSEIAPRMCIWSFPAGVVASMPSASETKSTPSACRSSSSVMRCLRLRPSRSSRQHTTTSKRRCWHGQKLHGYAADLLKTGSGVAPRGMPCAFSTGRPRQPL